MLRSLIYLDTVDLNQYVTALEGGSLTESTKRQTRTGTGRGGVDAKVVAASGERSREDEESLRLADTDEARFDRLFRAGNADPEELGWVEVMEPDTDLNGVGIGMMISWECDIFIPEVVQALAQSGELSTALGAVQRLMPMARKLGMDTEGLPDDDEINAMGGFINALNANLLVVGEDDDTEWRVAGPLAPEFLHGDVDGRAHVVGKVSKALAPGRWRPYVTFPGMNLLPREERRKMERQRPEPGQEDEYLEGPALMLNILAIFR